MKKTELVFLLLCEGLARTQLEASKRLGISLSTVNHALEPLEEMGAVRAERKGITVLDRRKLLLYWASVHSNKIAYSTSVESVEAAERELPPGVLLTSFSAFKRAYRSVPSDYSETYAYAHKDSLVELQKRFPPSARKHNFFVLGAPEQLFHFGGKGCVPLSLVFVDLWNNKEWYAAEFLKEMEGKGYG